MALPEINIVVQDGGLGAVGTGSLKNACNIGVSTGGTANTLYSFNSVDDVKSTLISGPLAEKVALDLATSGGPIFAVPVSATVAAVTGSVSYARATGAPSTGFVTASGTASASQTVVLKITNAVPDLVSSGNAMIATSTDGGATFGTAAALAMTGTLVVAGVSFTFTGLFYQNTLVRLALANGAAVTGSPLVTHAVGPVSTATLTVSGNPSDAYRARIDVTNTGIVESGTQLRFKYSLDDGASYSKEVSCPSSGAYLMPGTGVTLTLAGAFNKADIARFDTTAPGYQMSDAQAAFAALETGSSQNFPIVSFLGAASTASGAAAFAVGCLGIMDSATQRFRYGRAFCEAPEVSDTALQIAFQNVAGTRLSVGAGLAEVVSQLDGRTMLVNAQRVNTALMAGIPLSQGTHYVGAGALKFVTGIRRNEYLTQILDAARFVTLRTIVGAPGFYVTRPNMMSPIGSDYAQAPNCMVMDAACSITRRASLPYLNRTIRVDEFGYIAESDALSMETEINSALSSQLQAQPDVSGITVEVNRTTKVLSTNRVRLKIRSVPLAIVEELDVNIGLTNPALGA